MFAVIFLPITMAFCAGRCHRSEFRLTRTFAEPEATDESLNEPIVFSKRELFDHIQVDGPFVDYESQEELLRADESAAAEQEDEELQVEKFTFKIKKSDLEASKRYRSSLDASQAADESRLLLDSAMVDLLSAAAADEDNVIRMSMDYSDLQDMVQPAEDAPSRALNNFQDSYVPQSSRHREGQYKYDEARMREAIRAVTPAAGRRRTPQLFGEAMDKRSKPRGSWFELPRVSLSKRELSADALGTAVIGVALVWAALATETYAIAAVETAQRAHRQMIGRVAKGSVLHSLLSRSYPLVFLCVLIVRLTQVTHSLTTQMRCYSSLRLTPLRCCCRFILAGGSRGSGKTSNGICSATRTSRGSVCMRKAGEWSHPRSEASTPSLASYGGGSRGRTHGAMAYYSMSLV